MKSFIKSHGGKSYLAKWIISFFPEHTTFIDAFGGGGNIILNKSSVKHNIYNDVDFNLFCLFTTIKNNSTEFYYNISKLQYSENTFNKYKLLQTQDIFQIAIKEYVLRRMSRGGLTKNFAFSQRLRGGIPGDINAWNNAVDYIPIIAEKLKNIDVSCLDFCEIIKKSDSSQQLIYCDPPYLHKTRRSTATYKHEMTEKQHIELAHALNNTKSKIVLSGYYSELYNKLYKNWNVKTKEMPNHSSQQKTKQIKQEVIWMNF